MIKIIWSIGHRHGVDQVSGTVAAIVKLLSVVEMEYAGQSREMSVYFPDDHTHTIRLMLCQGGRRDLDERDRILFTLLRPQLMPHIATPTADPEPRGR
jgi:hypothetical protein